MTRATASEVTTGLLRSLTPAPARVSFMVFGSPRPKGSHRAFVVKGHAVVAPACKGEKEWRAIVSTVAARAMMDAGLEPLEGAVSVVMEFFDLRPKAHFRTNGEIKPGSQRRPTRKPDVDKLMRSVGDALSGICYRDDSQIVEAVLRKRYTNPGQPRCGVLVTVEAFEGEP